MSDDQTVGRLVAILTAFHNGERDMVNTLIRECDRDDLEALFIQACALLHNELAHAPDMTVDDYLALVGLAAAENVR